MSAKKRITRRTIVGMKITAAEWKVILDNVMCLDDNYAQIISDTPVEQPVQFTLDEWDDFSGYIAAAVNHTEDKKLAKKLDALFNKVQTLLDTHTDKEPPKIVKIEDARTTKVLSDQSVNIAEWAAKMLGVADKLGIKNHPLEQFSLSPAHRELLRLVPGVPKAIKGKLSKKKPSFTVAEVADMTMALAENLLDSDARKQVAVLVVAKHLMDHLQEEVVEQAKLNEGKTEKPKAKTTAAMVYQFKITLKDIEPPIWRRIQVKDCTLDELHEHIQMAMGWTNSHLHQFEIGGVLYGDPELLCEGFGDDPEIVNSLDTKVSKIVPESRKRFRFGYEYDFGDGWEHEILFEGCLKAEKGSRYPLCVEGHRACPPEDVGGSYGYQEYLAALTDSKHERHEKFMEWRGRFDPEKFDAKVTTKRMQRGLPNWREME